MSAQDAGQGAGQGAGQDAAQDAGQGAGQGAGQDAAQDAGQGGGAGAADAIPFPMQIPFVDTLGMTLHRFADGEAEVRLDVRPDLVNSFRVLHGGALMSLLDVAMAHAARSRRLPPEDPASSHSGVATLEMKTMFMRPATGAVTATGRLLHETGGMAFCEGRVHDAAGALCAHATATFKFVRSLGHGPATPAQPRPEAPAASAGD